VSSPGISAGWRREEPADHRHPLAFDVERAGAGGREGAAGLLAASDQGGQPVRTAYRSRWIAARISFDSDRDAFFGNFETLSANLGKAREMLKLALNASTLEAATLERTRAQFLARAALEAGDANKLANAQWMAQSFPGHAYSRAISGTPGSIRAIMRDDLDAYRSHILARRTLRVAAVGDIDANTLAKVLDDVFGGLPAEPKLAPIADVTPAAVPKPTVLKFEGPQSVAIFGRQGVARNHPDHMAALVVAQILGGGSSEARLVQEVREKRGRSSSILYTFKHAPVLRRGGPNERSAEPELIRSEFKQLAERGPSQQEVDAAKSYLIGSYVLSLDSNAKIAEQMLRAQLQGLGPDFISQRKAGLEKVTRADVLRVARTLLATDDLSVAIAGQPANLSP
jgi:zinc protease